MLSCVYIAVTDRQIFITLHKIISFLLSSHELNKFQIKNTLVANYAKNGTMRQFLNNIINFSKSFYFSV